MTTKAIEAGARASLAALKEWDDLEGPFGVYDLGYHAKEVVLDPHAVRDFRPGENGRIVARFATHEEAMAEYELLTAKHYAKACIEAAIASGELVPASAVAEMKSDLDALASEYAEISSLVGRQGNEEHKLSDDVRAKIASAVAAERERCAKRAESEPRVWDVSAPEPQQRIAAAIRAMPKIED